MDVSFQRLVIEWVQQNAPGWHFPYVHHGDIFVAPRVVFEPDVIDDPEQRKGYGVIVSEAPRPYVSFVYPSITMREFTKAYAKITRIYPGDPDFFANMLLSIKVVENRLKGDLSVEPPGEGCSNV